MIYAINRVERAKPGENEEEHTINTMVDRPLTA